MPQNKPIREPLYFDDDKTIFPVNSSMKPEREGTNLLDSSWAKNAFMVPDSAMEESYVSETGASNYDRKNRYWSSANYKFTSTRLGSNIGINARPQFTPYADIPVPGRFSINRNITVESISGQDNFLGTGMGRYYSEAIDDPSQIIYLRFGVPQHCGIAAFLTSAFNGGASITARTGQFPFLYKAAKAIGTVSAAMAFPGVAFALLSYKTIDRYLGSQSSLRYYSLKPTMHLYWGTVQTIVNHLAVNLGLLPKQFAKSNNTGQVQGRIYDLDPDYLSRISSMMPDIFPSYDPENAKNIIENKPSSIIDIFAVALKAQRLANIIQKIEYERLENDKEGQLRDFTGIVQKEGQTLVETFMKKPDNKSGGSFASWLNNIIQFGDYTAFTNEKDVNTIDPRNSEVTNEKRESWKTAFRNYIDSEIREGAQFASFRVDYTGSPSESFSNVTTESSISQKLNGISSDAKSTRFTLGDGEVGSGIIGSTIEGVIGGVKSIATGLASGVTFNLSDNILGLLTGIGYVDIPKIWQNSNANLTRANYSIQLRSPYGNIFSLIQNIYIPLAMLLAGSLPRSTGVSSYTAPYLCQVYDRGRVQIRLGMVESLSITRGTTNLGFNLKGVPLGIDVNISIVDLSSIMHMPISSGGLLDNDIAIDENNILTDYLAVLAGQDLNSQMYAIPRGAMRLAKDWAERGRIFSPAYMASTVMDTLANRLPFVYAPINAAVSYNSTTAGGASARPQ